MRRGSPGSRETRTCGPRRLFTNRYSSPDNRRQFRIGHRCPVPPTPSPPAVQRCDRNALFSSGREPRRTWHGVCPHQRTAMTPGTSNPSTSRTVSRSMTDDRSPVVVTTTLVPRVPTERAEEASRTSPIMRCEVPDVDVRGDHGDREPAGGPGSGTTRRGWPVGNGCRITTTSQQPRRRTC